MINQMVEEFATAAKQPINEGMSINLVCEEYGEWFDEADVDTVYKQGELKELADLVYVIYGRARTMGYDLDEAVARVHWNNMGRMMQADGSIKFREDGKVIKNPEYPKVDFSDLV